ncbi:MAG: TonB-dependent receptor, partial [Halioglobus sp.]|nr:TonB-dependent receptor [Halioglobus sp.]
YSMSERDGFVDNKGAGKDWGMEDRSNITADLHWDAGDTVSVDYKFEQSNIEDTARLSQILRFDGTQPLAGIIQFTDPTLNSQGQPQDTGSDRKARATSFDTQERGDIEIEAHTLNLGWDINETLTLRSITGYRDFDAFTQNSQTPTTSLAGVFSVTNGMPVTEFEQFSQEFQLLVNTDTVNWVGGLYYYEDESEENNLGNTQGTEALPPGALRDLTTTENTSIALFSQGTWTPESLQDWHFTLGFRYSDDNRKAFRDNNRVSFGFGGAPTPVPAFIASYDQNFDEFNPSFTVEYDLDEYANVYAKVVTAYKSGGTSQRSTSSQNFERGFDPEDLVSYELGYKGDLLDGRMRFNAAVFYMEFEGYQQSVQTGRNAGERDFVNIDDAEITGLEFDLTLAITEALTGTLSYGYLDTSFGQDSISYLQIDDSAPGGLSTVMEPLTEDLALAPEHTITASLDYSRPVGPGILEANINAQYQDESNGGVQAPTGRLNDRTLLAATLGISAISLGGDYGSLRVSIWGNNLLDEEYHIGNIRQPTFDDLGFVGGLATFGDPRTYGVTLEYSFN